jgi:hypothetical protein
LGFAWCGLVVACSSGTPSIERAARPSTAFEPVSERVYAAKVKNILLGLPPTDAEVAAVEADPGALSPLVDSWLKEPEYQRKMRRFLELAFQQTQINANDFADEVHGQLGLNDSTTPLLLENAEESFARTVLELDAEGRPFTEAMSTTRLMMTTALKEFYAFLDTVEIDDDANTFDHYRATHLDAQIVAEAAQGPIPISETLDATSPNYLHWYNPDVATALAEIPGCRQDPMNLPNQAVTLHWLLLGSLDGRTLRDGSLCPVFPGSASASQFAVSDFSDWSMVALRAPGPNEATSTFFDLPALRAARELVLSMPRSGFFSTPAFFANFPTNVSNQMRVTTQQALIVATNSFFDGTDTTAPSSTPGLDAAHAGSAACVGCHQLLDPTRSILAATWSWNYHNQQDPAFSSEPGLFAFRGVVAPVHSVADFGALLATHPLVAPGWVQKLCYYVNSAPCSEQDPEFSRVVALFRSSNYSFSALVKAFVTSPLVTYAKETESARASGEVVAIARRDHLCAALDARLGLVDVCGLSAQSQLAATGSIAEIGSGLPADGYGRGAVVPILPSEPSLFFRAGVENLCEFAATQVIDPAPGSGFARWTSDDPETAIGDFISGLMALTASDPREAPARALLEAHFQSAIAKDGISATDALRSTFVVACLSPSLVSIGL